MKKIFPVIITAAFFITGSVAIAIGNPFKSYEVGTNATNGYFLKTDGTNSSFSLVTPSSVSLSKGNFLTGNDNDIAQATSSIFISSTGKIGVGTTTPTEKLTVFGNGLFDDRSNGSYIAGGIGGAGKITFRDSVTGHMSFNNLFGFKYLVNNVESMRIDSGGNFIIGTTTNSIFDQVGGPRPLVVYKSDTSTTVGGSTAAMAIVNGSATTNNTAQINFAASTDSVTNLYSSAIISTIFGPRTTGQYPMGQLAFLTSTALNQAPSEKMRIDNNGNVGIGTTTPNALLTFPTGTNAAGGISFSDATTNLYRNSTGKLQTDGTFYAGVNIGAGNSFFFFNSALLMYPTVATSDLGNAYTFTDNGGSTLRQIKISSLRLATSTGAGLLSSLNNDGSAYFSGNVGIGTTSPATPLDVKGTITQSTVKSCSLGLTTDALGSITGCVASDERLKKNIQPLVSSIEKLLKLSPVTYQWKDTKKDTMTHSGFIAQSVEKVFPSAVVSAGTDIKGVDSNAILSLVVKSFQDFYKQYLAKEDTQDKQIKELQLEVKSLQLQIKNKK